MKRLAFAIAVLALASLADAAVNLNSSKSNAYRMTYSTAIVTPAQAAAILAELDKMPQMDDSAIKQALPRILRKNGVDPSKVKKTLIRPDDAERKSVSIIVLDKPEDEPAAIAVSDDGAPKGKGKVKPWVKL